jgi:fructose-bisphosphate aldolase/2-amino-3,7-dideoxy-D-threo-hept-6-ulosonate synthase
LVFGKAVRLSRITEDGKMLCVPMDHGFTMGPVRGLEDPRIIIRAVAQGGATAVLVHKGVIKALREPPATGIILHISGNTTLGPSPNRKVLVSSVEEGILLGADAISVHINIGGKDEPEMIQQLGSVGDACDELQMPLIAMMYPRGESIKSEFDPEIVAQVARVGAEAGADLVKTVYTGDPQSFKRVVATCPVPVVIAGGPKAENDGEVLKMAEGAMEAGAAGVTFGRNIFQHRDPTLITRALYKVVFEGAPASDALRVLQHG